MGLEWQARVMGGMKVAWLRSWDSGTRPPKVSALLLALEQGSGTSRGLEHGYWAAPRHSTGYSLPGNLPGLGPAAPVHPAMGLSRTFGNSLACRPPGVLWCEQTCTCYA